MLFGDRHENGRVLVPDKEHQESCRNRVAGVANIEEFSRTAHKEAASEFSKYATRP
jgi:hypothetical protein